MTDVMLVSMIATELRGLLSSQSLKALCNDVFEDITVYEHNIPLPEDEDDTGLHNYIVIMAGDENSDDEEWNVEIHFSINIEDWDKKRPGVVNVLNLMNEIYTHFITKGIIGGYSRMEKKAYKAINHECPYPYYEADLVTNWKFMLPFEEGLGEFI